MMHPSKVAGVMVMLASALQRPHADNKARETKVETSVALQQEVKIKLNFQPIESLKVKPTQLPANCVLYIICHLFKPKSNLRWSLTTTFSPLSFLFPSHRWRSFDFIPLQLHLLIRESIQHKSHRRPACTT